MFLAVINVTVRALKYLLAKVAILNICFITPTNFIMPENQPAIIRNNISSGVVDLRLVFGVISSILTIFKVAYNV